MEAEERPTKLRKLGHGYYDADGARTAQAQIASTSARDAEAEQSTEAAADQDLAEEQEDSDDGVEINAEGSEAPEQPQTSSGTTNGQLQPLSKNQLKKIKRKAEWEAGREDRKLKRKEKQKEAKARKRAAKVDIAAAQVQNAQPQQDATADIQQQLETKPQRGQFRGGRRHTLLPISFIVDCGFDSLMHDRELISMGSQLTRAYSDNSKAPYQAHLYVSGWTEETALRKRFEGLLKGMYKNWRGIRFVEDDFVVAAKMAEEAMKVPGSRGGRLEGAFEKYQPKTVSEEEQQEQKWRQFKRNASQEGNEAPQSPYEANPANEDTSVALPAVRNGYDSTHIVRNSSPQVKESSEVIYLTSDSPYTLTELLPYHTYIIGGLVDKNRHKGICYRSALDANQKSTTRELLGAKDIKTAKLPIGQYMDMTSRQVLATNHVAEIMLRWLECGDWGEAFLKVLPKRKGAVLKTEDKAGGEISKATATGNDEQNDERHQEDEEDSQDDASNSGVELDADTYAQLAQQIDEAQSTT